MNDAQKFLLFIVALFVIWFTFGGPRAYENDPSRQGTFITPLEPLNTGVTYNAGNKAPSYVPPSTWHAAETDYFTLWLPAGWYVVELQGIDSYVGQITNGTTTFYFDYGIYSTHLIREGDTRYTVTYEEIDNDDAELIRPKTAEGNISGVYIDHGSKDLTISATGLSSTNTDLLFNIARTVQFK